MIRPARLSTRVQIWLPVCYTATTAEDNNFYDSQALLSFKPVSSMHSIWGDLSGEDFMKAIDDAYAQVVHWRPNRFNVSSGPRGKQFVAELAHLFDAFPAESDLEAIALKAAMTLPLLILQKPQAKSKTHDHILCLQCSLRLWQKGDIADLLKESKALKKLLACSRPLRRDSADVASTAYRFSTLMIEGRLEASI